MLNPLRIRCALVGMLSLLVLGFTLSDGYSQFPQPPGFPGRPNMPRPPGFGGGIAGGGINGNGIAGGGLPNRPGLGGPMFQSVWKCGRCRAILGTGPTPPSLPNQKCPMCGATLINAPNAGGAPAAGNQGGGTPFPGGGRPPAQSGGTNPPPGDPNIFNFLGEPAESTDPQPTPQVSSQSSDGSASSSESDAPPAKSGSRTTIILVIVGVMVVGAVLLLFTLLMMNSSRSSSGQSKNRKRRRRYDDDDDYDD